MQAEKFFLHHFSFSYSGIQPIFYLCAGEMAERSNAAVLKTVEGNTSGGSNPSLSAHPVAPALSGGLLFAAPKSKAPALAFGCCKK
jgi:hypothetical protein